MKRFDWQRHWQDFSAQWESSLILRVGMLAVLLLLAYGALAQLGDWRERLAAEAQDLDQGNAELAARLKQSDWAQRRKEADDQLQAVRSMVWQAADEASAQAMVQDWLRSAVAKADIKVRELEVGRQTEANAGSEANLATAAGANAKASGGLDPQFKVLRVRMTLDMQRLQLMMLLTQLAANDKVFAVERVQFRLVAQPATAVIDLRTLVEIEGGTS